MRPTVAPGLRYSRSVEARGRPTTLAPVARGGRRAGARSGRELEPARDRPPNPDPDRVGAGSAGGRGRLRPAAAAAREPGVERGEVLAACGRSVCPRPGGTRSVDRLGPGPGAGDPGRRSAPRLRTFLSQR